MTSDRVYDHSTNLLIERRWVVHDGVTEDGYVHVVGREDTSSPSNDVEEPEPVTRSGREANGLETSYRGSKSQPRRRSRREETQETAAQGQNTSTALQSGACQACGGLYMEPGNYYSTDARKLKDSSKRGCVPCTVLNAGCRQFNQDVWDRESTAFPIIFAPTTTALQVALSKATLDHSDSDRLDFYTLEGLPSPWERFGACRHLADYADTSTRLNLARTWLEACESNHNDCGPKVEPVLPRRILRLRFGGNSKDVVLLDFSQTQAPTSRYACLSHCWGGLQPLRLETENLNSMRSRIAWGTLPKTFQDAIDTARELGLKYLWIDSLCIIQDSREDWKREAAAMASIYGNATITITATSAINCHAGFLHQYPNRSNFFRFILDVENAANETKTYTIYIRPSHNHDRFTFGKKSTDPAVPLRDRAWAFQEYLLSPRSLQFGPTEMVWECNSETKCECGAGFQMPQIPNQRRQQQQQERIPSRIKAQYKRVLSTPVPPPRQLTAAAADANANNNNNDDHPFRDFWQVLVRDYTAKKITQDADRLVALEGIANQVRDSLQGLLYFAGLWWQHLPQALAWWTAFCTPGRRPSPREEEDRVPSWSWASVEHESGVVYAPKFVAGMATACDIRREVDGSTGIAGLYLEIIGLVVEGTVRRSGVDRPATGWVVEREEARIPVYLDVEGEVEHGDVVSCLVLGRAEDRFVMLVCKMLGDGTGRYRRVGTTGSYRKSREPLRFTPLENPSYRIVKII